MDISLDEPKELGAKCLDADLEKRTVEETDNLQSHFHVSQHPSQTCVAWSLGHLGLEDSGQTTGVNSIFPSLQLLS